MIKTALALSALLLISGCAQNSNTATSNAPAPDTVTEQNQTYHQVPDQWAGRWTGVEGLFLDISKKEDCLVVKTGEGYCRD